MNTISIKNRFMFWLHGARTSILLIIVAFAVGVILINFNSRIGSEKVIGVAHAHTFVASDFGNKPKLSVMLSDGNLTYVSISSPGQLKIGESVCLIKSKNLLGATVYGFGHVGKCR